MRGRTLLIGLAEGNLLACGDKFLVPSRGMRFELTPAARQQAAVLFYANPATSLPDLFAKLSVDQALRKAGYRPTVVATAEEFDETLRQSRWHVVVLDVADGAAGSAASGSPSLVAVATNPSELDVATAKKQCAAILKSPRQSQAFVQALDAAMANHQKRAKSAKAALRPAAAQAWVLPARTGAVTFVFQEIDHVGRMQRIRGRRPDRPLQPHQSQSDVQVTPSISIGVPTHDYEYVGEAVVGRQLNELSVAVDAGQRLDELLRGLSVQAGYRYSIVERSLDIPNNRSNGLAQAAYAFTNGFSARGVFSWQRTHGGVRVPEFINPNNPLYPELRTEFHRLLRDNYLHVGAGAAYAWGSWDISGSFLITAKGSNSHDIRVFSVTVGRSFEVARNGRP